MKRAHLWPLAMTAILAGTVAMNIAVMVIAADDPSFAIERDYYARAVSWDSTVVQEARNRALGWRLVPTLSAFADDGAVLRVSVRDATGAAIADARVHVSALFVARANDVIELPLAPDGAAYAARLPVARGGAWELRFVVERGGHRFTSTQRLEARPAAVRGT